MDYLNPNSTNQRLFTNSHDPQAWIENMKILWVIFTINGILRGFTSFATLFWYIIPIAVFAFAIYKRKKLYFGFVLIALIPVTIMEIINFFNQFSKPFGYAVLGIIFTIFALLLIVYTAFCNHKMFREYPEGLDYSQHHNVEPMNRDEARY